MNNNKNQLILGLISLLAILIIAPIRFSVGTVPITMQTFILFIVAAINKPKVSFTIGLSYLILGALGLPVFASFQSGYEKLIGPTAGFLWAFPLVMLYLSYRTNSFTQSFFSLMISFLLVHFILLIPGFIYLNISLDNVNIWNTFIRLLPGLLIKSIVGGPLAYMILNKVREF